MHTAKSELMNVLSNTLRCYTEMSIINKQPCSSINQNVYLIFLFKKFY